MKTALDLANEWGVSVDSVRRWARAAGFSLPRGGKAVQREFSSEEEVRIREQANQLWFHMRRRRMK